MKTNHQRNFKDGKSRATGKDGRGDSGKGGRKYGKKETDEYGTYTIGFHWVRFYEERKCPLSDKVFCAAVTHQDGHPHHGYARAKKGAKKFLNSRERFHENQTLRNMAAKLKGD